MTISRKFGFFRDNRMGYDGNIPDPLSFIVSESLTGTEQLNISVNTNVGSGNVLYYEFAGNISSADFTDSSITGTITLDSNGDATITKFISADPSAFPVGTKQFSLLIRRGNASGPIVATSNTITITNPGGDYLFATGGNSTSIGSDRYHIFKSSANLSVTRTSSTFSNSSNCLVVAGGGYSRVRGGASAGKNYNSSPGGGAGGLLDSSLTFTTQIYPITVGIGGDDGIPQGDRGGNSSISNTIIAVGGGGGGSDLGEVDGRFRLRNGGSGGGSEGFPVGQFGIGIYPGSSYIDAPRQGYDGGGAWGFITAVQSGGGGGRNSAGVSGVVGQTGGGGSGYQVSWLPSNLCVLYDIGESNVANSSISTSGRGNVFASGGSGFNSVNGAISNVNIANNAWKAGGGGGFYDDGGTLRSRKTIPNTGGGGTRPYFSSPDHLGHGASGVVVVKYTCDARKLSL
jgi:hypothetical protein